MLPEAVYRTRQIRDIEQMAGAAHGMPDFVLMRRAGAAAFKHLMARYSRLEHLVVVCGPGNNGGDGYVVAGCARRIGIRVTVLAVAEPRTAAAAATRREYDHDGGAVTDDLAILATADLLVDGLFGLGLRRAPAGAAAECIAAMNRVGCPVLALDVPSGLHSDTGRAFAQCVTASVTVTFIGLKMGLLTGQGRSRVGEIVLADLNIPAAARRAAPAARIIQPPVLEKRRREMHKGEAGRVLIVGGSRGMLGAALLAGEAALRCGGGVVTVAVAEACLDWPALRCPELMSVEAQRAPLADLLARADVVVLGPGLGQSPWSERVFERFIGSKCRLVVDADGLNWLARAGAPLASPAARQPSWTLTPHPGEAARLLQCAVADIQADRPAAAREIAARFGAVCVLKGPGTLVADAAGALLVCEGGNPGMATAGMGDVLSGIAGAMLASARPHGRPHDYQRDASSDASSDASTDAPSVLRSAATAVWLHSAAADAAARAVGERSLLARDVIAHLPFIFMPLEA